MARGEQPGLLEILKAEFKFIEEGGYRRPFRNDWRAQFIFEDSPTCMDYAVPRGDFAPCRNCVLMPLIPDDYRSAKSPCRRIPLNRAGETLDTLYRWADQSETEITVRRWLQGQIERLENSKGKETYP